jgi:hypothetical protein
LHNKKRISLGDKEDLTCDIVSNVLDGSNDDEEEKDSNTGDETDQDATNTGTVNPNQDQTEDQDNVGGKENPD